MITIASRARPRAPLFVATAAGALGACSLAWADPSGPSAQSPVTTADASASTQAAAELVVTASQTTRSAVLISGAESQKLLPGVSPLKAIETLRRNAGDF